MGGCAYCFEETVCRRESTQKIWHVTPELKNSFICDIVNFHLSYSEYLPLTGYTDKLVSCKIALLSVETQPYIQLSVAMTPLWQQQAAIVGCKSPHQRLFNGPDKSWLNYFALWRWVAMALSVQFGQEVYHCSHLLTARHFFPFPMIY